MYNMCNTELGSRNGNSPSQHRCSCATGRRAAEEPSQQCSDVRSSPNWHLLRNAILYMTTNIANRADNLRAALKQAGFNARKVTVRQHHSTLYVTVRDASASLSRVTEIAGQFEQVRRDHATGEIFCGGYVSNHITAVMW